jgi:hypothetical protein
VRLFSTVTLVRVGNQAPEFSQGALSAKGGWPKREASSPRNRQAIRIVQLVSCPALSVPGNASFLNRILALKQITRCPALQVLLQRPLAQAPKRTLRSPVFPRTIRVRLAKSTCSSRAFRSSLLRHPVA